MVDIESLLEKAQALKGRENGIRWELAEIADQIVGSPLGRAGATKQLAQVCGLSAVDAIEHWAKAWRLYRVLCRYEAEGEFMFSELYKLSFSVSHFYKMWELGHKYKLSISSIMNFFNDLYFHKSMGDKWSVAELEMLVLAEQTNTKAVNWRWHWTRLEKHMQELLTFDGELPPVVRSIARMYLGVKERIK